LVCPNWPKRHAINFTLPHLFPSQHRSQLIFQFQCLALVVHSL
jgi:hypothetical protein